MNFHIEGMYLGNVKRLLVTILTKHAYLADFNFYGKYVGDCNKMGVHILQQIK